MHVQLIGLCLSEVMRVWGNFFSQLCYRQNRISNFCGSIFIVLGDKDSQRGFGGKGVAVDLSTNYNVSPDTKYFELCPFIITD